MAKLIQLPGSRPVNEGERLVIQLSEGWQPQGDVLGRRRRGKVR